MGRPKGSTKKPVIAPPPAVYGTEKQEATVTPAIEPEKAEIKPETYPNDCFIYSENDPPMVLKAGTPVPAGYTKDRTKIKQFWRMDGQGKFVKG